MHAPTSQLMPQQALPLDLFSHFFHSQCVIMLHRSLVQMESIFLGSGCKMIQKKTSEQNQPTKTKHRHSNSQTKQTEKPRQTNKKKIQTYDTTPKSSIINPNHYLGSLEKKAQYLNVYITNSKL